LLIKIDWLQFLADKIEKVFGNDLRRSPEMFTARRPTNVRSGAGHTALHCIRTMPTRTFTAEFVCGRKRAAHVRIDNKRHRNVLEFVC